jgi:hypothetical protein
MPTQPAFAATKSSISDGRFSRTKCWSVEALPGGGARVWSQLFQVIRHWRALSANEFNKLMQSAMSGMMMSCIVRLLGRPSFVVIAMLVLAGCSSIPRTPYTASDAASSRMLDLRDLRRYADEPASTFSKETREALRAGSHSYLALSGGGADGA